MNAQASINLRNAFAASGMIRAEHNALERHRRELLLAPLEDALADAWRAECCAFGRKPVDPEFSARMAALSKHARDKAAAANRAKRRAKKDRIIGLLREAPMRAGDLEGLMHMSNTTIKLMLREMVNDEEIIITRIAGERGFVYEVAQ